MKVPNNAFVSNFVLKSDKPQRKRIYYCSKHTVKMQWVVHKCLTGSVDLKRVESPLIATLARGRPFLDSEGIVHHEYAPDGQTVNKEFYVKFLRTFA